MVGQSRRVLFIAALLPLCLTAGCLRQEYETFRHGRTLEEVRSIHEPLIAGQVQLAEALNRLEKRTVVFELSRGGAERLDEPARATDLRNVSRVILFELLDPESGAVRETAYLNPRTLQLESIRGPDSESAGGGSWVRTGPGEFSVLRSLPDRRPLVFWGAPRRSIYRFDFEFGEAGVIESVGFRKLTEGDPWDSEPLIDPTSGRVAFVRRGEDERRRLMMTDVNGKEAWEVFPDAGFDVQAPQLLDDGRLIFSSDSGGYRQLYEMDFGGKAAGEGEASEGKPRVRVYSGDPPAGPEPEVLIANTSLSDEGAPELLTLPERYDLKTLTAFASARNANVNQKRALLAATLAEAAQRRFENWPIIDLSLFYTPIVGVFLEDPILTSGDFISEDISRGLFGVAQPLLDFRRNAALEQADLWRAEVARDAVANELNERIAEVAELYFEAQYRRRQTAVDAALIESGEARVEYFKRLRTQSQATLADILAAEQAVEGMRSEADFHARRLEFVKSRLREVCGLPAGTELRLAEEEFFLDQYEPDPLERMRAIALMNHPNLESAEAAISRAFYIKEAGPSRRPTAFASATYGQSRRDFTEPVDDFITLALQGKYPLGSYQVRQLFNEQWEQTLEAMHFETEALRRSTATSMEEAWLDLMAAKRDYEAKRSTLDYRAEELRVARLRAEYGPPGEEPKFDPTTVIGARQSFLYALEELSRVEKDLGIRFAHLWREMGLAERLPEEAGAFGGDRYLRRQPSIWLWYTREALQDDASFESFVELVERHQPRRIYAYLYSDARLLEEPSARERLITMLQFCAARDVEVWGLLGEPEWLEAEAEAALDRAIERILQFNRARAPLEAGLAGVKLDLEPHSEAGWLEGGEERERLIRRYLALLDAAREALGGALPLWADLSTQYFNEELTGLLEALTPRLDGATVMAYFSDPERIRGEGLKALERFPGPVEVGVELSREAPEGVRLPPMSLSAFEGLTQGLRQDFGTKENFQGLALHDYRGVRAYFEDRSGAESDPGRKE